MQTDFLECDTCAALPGTPPLCSGCLHNREVIEKLKKQVKHLDLECRVAKAIELFNLGCPVKDANVTADDLIEYIIDRDL